jgi:hypothetical protein
VDACAHDVSIGKHELVHGLSQMTRSWAKFLLAWWDGLVGRLGQLANRHLFAFDFDPRETERLMTAVYCLPLVFLHVETIMFSSNMH